MIVGIDIVHHAGRDHESVLGFAASMDKYVGKYFITSRKTANPDRKKKPSSISFEMESLFQQAILNFKESCGIAPQRIIVYRDAVSEGQNEITRQTEVP